VIPTPNIYIKVINSPKKNYWLKAINYKLKTLKNNNTWDIINKTSNIKPFRTRWVYKVKNLNNNLIEFKAKFVVKKFE